ncbi:hypothetical protein BGX38DRAFT_328599 [Terfezia claveryi]|nr:hypothetical protein BGX38DRAFT_328599 [Terfezia claveryi]
MEVEADLMARGAREEVSDIRVGVDSEIVGVGIRMGTGIMELHRRMPLQDQVGGDLVVVEVGMRMAEGGSEIGVGLETVEEGVVLVAGIVDSAVIETVEEETVGMAGDMEVIGTALAEDSVIVIRVEEMVGMVEVGMAVVAQGMIMAGRDSTMGMDIVVAEATPEGEGIRPPLSLQKTPIVCAFGKGVRMVNTFVCVCVCVYLSSPTPAGTAEFFTFSFLHFLQLSGRPNPAESPFVICSQNMDTTYAREYLF